MDKTELNEWMRKHNVAEELRLALDEMRRFETYESFEDLAVTGKATVLVTIDERNNIHFSKVEKSTTTIEPIYVSEMPVINEPLPESLPPEKPKSKPRKVPST